jgi:hypothetical protein
VHADVCATEEPPLRQVGDRHRSRCHFDTWAWQDQFAGTLAPPAGTAAEQGQPS